MSWTSESEPQSHTTDEGDVSAPETNGGGSGSSSAVEDAAHSADADGALVSAGSQAGRRNGDGDIHDDRSNMHDDSGNIHGGEGDDNSDGDAGGIDDDGFIDPSLFFGLFDDLTSDADAEDTRGEDRTEDTRGEDGTDNIDDSVDEIDTGHSLEIDDIEVDGSDEDEGWVDVEGGAAASSIDELFMVDRDDDSDVVILGDLPPETTVEADTGSQATSSAVSPDELDPELTELGLGAKADDAVVEEIDRDGPEPESTDDGVGASGTAATVEPVVESGSRQPVVSPPKVLSPATDTGPPVDEPRSTTGLGGSVAGPGLGLGVVLAAVLLTFVVVLIAAIVVLGGDSGSETDAAAGTEPAAPADGAGTAVDEAAFDMGDETAQTAPGIADPGFGAQDDASVQDQASPAVTTLARELAEGRVDLTSIRFVAGTVEPTEASRRLVEELAEAVLASGGQPISVVVRTYSEATPADNQTLSEAQAAALVELLAAEGVPADQLVAVGLGSGPLSPQQPVPDFVVVNPELGDAVFKQVIADIGIFTLGSQLGESEAGRSSNPLRIESLAVVDGVGQALVNFQDSTIGLAGYSYFEPDNQSNRARAGQVLDAVSRRLSEVHGIGPDRVTIITPGAAPYVVTPEVGNHVWIRAGARTTTAFEVAGVDTSAIEFDPGSPAPSASSSVVLDQLAAAVATSTDTLVIDVRTYSEATGAANMELSQERADAIAAYLVETGGVEAGRLRAFGSGASSYFPDNGGSRVTVTVIP